jgi:uncharacterized heparinase superfamily protein
VSFLNRTLDIASGDRVDWYADSLDGVPRLWRLKLYAFEPLEWALLGYEREDNASDPILDTFEGWVRDWTETVDIGGPNYLRRAWAPYAVSLRLLNWSRYLSCRQREGGADSFDATLARELYKNASFLANHVERDVGGNHLIENGAGLVAAGVLFGDAGRPWVDLGVSVLEDAAETQFLDDGCHFERSPMYHVQTVTRYLTVRDLLGRADRSVPDAIEETATNGVAYLEYVRPPDGDLPLLNDSVHGQTLQLEACLDYARATGITPDEGGQSGEVTSRQPDGTRTERSAGYGWLDAECGRMLVDGGPVGPPHLPGHAHSDLLSYLLWIDETPVVTDTGTFDYEGGERRQLARGVRGHNTVQVDDTEPIELGGRFLMGPRPTPTVRWEYGDVDFFEGSYRTRPFHGSGYHHHRSIAVGDRWWFVWDRVSPHEGERVRSRVHLHPDVDVSRRRGRAHLTFGTDEEENGDAWIHPLGNGRLTVEEGPYFPEFGVAVDRRTVSIETSSDPSTPTTIGYLVTVDDVTSPTVEQDSRGRAIRLTVRDDDYALPRSTVPLNGP